MINFSKQIVRNRFGSVSGLINTLKFGFLLRIGCFKKYQKISFAEVNRLVFICSGNICRSPVAEYVAKQQGAEAISFGLHCRGGDGADPRAIEYAQTIGVDLTEHITKNIKHYVPTEGDLLVGMEPKHAQELESLLGGRTPITLAGLWLKRAHPYIHDPFSVDPVLFNKYELRVVNATQGLIAKIGKRDGSC